jgi:nucleotide-binding universal stress UspA family protein
MEGVMAVKSILVPMAGSAIDRYALDLALVLARPSAALIEGLYSRRDPAEALAYGGMGMGGELIGIGEIMEQLEREGRAGSARARRTFDDWAATTGLHDGSKAVTSGRVSVEWQEDTGTPDQIVTRAGARADLVVCAALQREPGIEQDFIEAALFGAARPVVLAPHKLPGDPFRSAVIAWNGSHEANRTVAAALALLPRFDTVHLFCEAEGHRPPQDSEQVLKLLARHGVEARRLAPHKPTGDLGPDLLKAAASVDASMLIMGAFTHGRTRQMVFGGVTHHVLHHTKLPTFLAH